LTQVAPLGGSDDHHGGVNDTGLASPLGYPTTLVLAANLSHAAIVEGIRLGRTVVKMHGPTDPMVVLTVACGAGSTATVVQVGGWCIGGGGIVSITVSTAAAPTHLHLLRNNGVTFTVYVPAHQSNFVVQETIAAPVDGGVDRWRAELRDSPTRDDPRVITNHVFIRAA
jgi:hypothetical protein